MTVQKKPAENATDLPAPIQLTPDQIKEVAGGYGLAPNAVIRKGIPAAS